MIRLVISILLFIILAVFVALNAQNTTTIDVFGYEFEEVSVAAVVTITLAVGVLYSFILYVTNYFSKARAERLKNQKRKNKVRATELAEKEKVIKKAPSNEGPASPETTPEIEYAEIETPPTRAKRTKKRRAVEHTVGEESPTAQTATEVVPDPNPASDSGRKSRFKLGRKERAGDQAHE